MAFDTQTRNRLARLVADCRDLLTVEFDAKLQEFYGIYADEGRVLSIDKLVHLDDERLHIARLLRERIEHVIATDISGGLKGAVKRVLREQAFTVLNRFAAIRMAEERGIMVESVGGGLNSKAFKMFSEVAFSGLGDAYSRYRAFLRCTFDELSSDLGTLFDRSSPYGLLFPRQDVLLELFKTLNAPDLKNLWIEDETIGWIYQYYNDPSERKKMREESSAPRNSRELAVRNQFFTPRYVVEFLTDNTLGRLWYEMTRGETVLRDRCHYLVRRPTEMFLKEGESAPENTAPSVVEEIPSQEDLLRAPVHIPHRPLKDPRTIRVLDPACGSMHFGLYAFDLFECIYDEAWEIGHGTDEALKSAPSFAPFVTYAAQFADKAAFLREVPRLIVEHNLHGIDIDPRAAQIAGLSLWLRAHRAWQRAGVKPADRPRITRSNLVCAEPMPGEKELLREFVEGAFPAGERPAFAFLLEKIFDCMTLAGEAGSLLRIEEEIRTAIAEARALAQRQSTPRQAALFAGTERPEQEEFNLRGLTDEQFWKKAEERIYEALESYAVQAENGGGFQRRLFADDAAQGFAFIDLCRKRYDVVVMNPPFGEAALSTRSYIATSFPESKDDIYAAFVARGVKMLAHGFLGVISNRTGFFLTGMRRWRESILLASPSLSLLADLGDGVLDGALVEAAAYTLHENDAPCAFFRLLDQADKARPLLESISAASEGRVARGTFVNPIAAFQLFPECRVSYWAPPSVRKIYRTLRGASSSGLEVKFGLSTKDDWRFLRLCWEVAESKIVSTQDDATRDRPWMYLAKGGEYSLHFADIHLVANWAKRGNEIAARVIQLYPYLNGDANWVLHTEVPYGRPGVTYTKRTTSGFSPRMLPPGCLISDKGCTVFADDNAKLPRVLATYGSRSFGYLLEFNVASGDSVHSGSAARDYEIGTVAGVPIPSVTALSDKAGDDVIAIWKRKAAADGREETSRYFLLPCPRTAGASIRHYAAARRASDLEGFVEILEEAAEAEDAVRTLYGFDSAAREACEAEFGPEVTSYPRDITKEGRELLSKLWSAGMSEVVAETSRALGFARFISKMTFLTDRRLELICHRVHAHPKAIANLLGDLPATDAEAAEVAQATFSYVLGCVFGRWDIRYATGERPAPELPDPFAPLPVCPPGMLQSADGLPLSPEEGRQFHAADQYPLDVAWDGILVDDPEHPLDLERRVHAALQVLWPERADDLEHEACALLGVPGLREWFRRPAAFFADHLRRYSKSRRQAPIYWPLSTASGRYTLWVYYHRISDQTLFHCVNNFVKPKIVEVEADLARAMTASGDERTKRSRIEELTTFRSELVDFRDELLRVGQLPYKPNLNDGALITAAPLWRLFHLPKWQKALKECWDELSLGKYDWAHLALTLWPERVKKSCEADHSLAIAHGLEGSCKTQSPSKKVKASAKTLIVEMK